MQQTCPICWCIVDIDLDDWSRDMLPTHLLGAHGMVREEDGTLTPVPVEPTPVPVLHLRTRHAATVDLPAEGEATVDVTWSPAPDMPSAAYQVSVALAPDLADLVDTAVVAQTPAGVQVRLTAPSLAVAASSLHVTAIALTQED